MALITIGLSSNRPGFYDPLTNIYLTKEKSMATIDISEEEYVKGRYVNLLRGLSFSPPSLVLYEGDFEFFHAKSTTNGQEITEPISDEVVPAIENVDAKQPTFEWQEINNTAAENGDQSSNSSSKKSSDSNRGRKQKRYVR